MNLKQIMVILLTVTMITALASCGAKIEINHQPSNKDAAGNWIFDDTVLVGRVVPLTGQLSSFGEGTPYVEQMAFDTINKNGGMILDGKRCKLEMMYMDSGSGVKEADAAARKLISRGVDIMMVSHTADTVMPVSAVCERKGIVCISVDAPASAWEVGGPYQNSWHTFFDNEMEMTCFLEAWEKIDSNRTIGLLTANDSEGIEITTFITEFAAAKNYKIIDPGRYKIGTGDYSNIVKTFERNKCDIILGVMKPPDFKVFWNEFQKSNYRPKMCTIAKACLFAEDVEAMGPSANGLITEVWWNENFPFVSSINGWTAKELARDYRDQYNLKASVIPPTVGYKHANVEILYDILSRAGSLNTDAVNKAAKQTSLDTVAGHVAFNDYHVSVMPCVTGQWVMSKDGAYTQEIIANSLIPQLGVTADVFLLPGWKNNVEEETP